MPISRPRTASISCSLRRSRSVPRKRIAPDRTRARAGRRRRIERARIVLPPPLSPTTARAEPSRQSRSISSSRDREPPVPSRPTVSLSTERSVSNSQAFSSLLASESDFETLDSIHDVAIVRVLSVDVEVKLVGALGLAVLLVNRRQVVPKPHPLLGLDRRRFEPFLEPLNRQLRQPLLDEAEPQHAAAFHG